MTGALLRVHYKGPNRRRLRRLGRRGELKTPVGTVGRRSGLLTSPAEFVSQHLRSSLHPGAKIQPWPGIRHGTSTTQDTLVPRRRTSQQKGPPSTSAPRPRVSRGGCPACWMRVTMRQAAGPFNRERPVGNQTNSKDFRVRGPRRLPGQSAAAASWSKQCVSPWHQDNPLSRFGGVLVYTPVGRGSRLIASSATLSATKKL